MPRLCSAAAAVFAALLSTPPTPHLLPPPLPLLLPPSLLFSLLELSSLLSTPNLRPPPAPQQFHVGWGVWSCQSPAGPAKQCVLVRGEAGANGRGVVVGPAGLPPPSSGPPRQIEPPAGRHGARHGPMLRAHMPKNTHSHMDKRTHT